MGMLIHQKAAVDTILEHVNLARARSEVRGGEVGELAAAHLTPIYTAVLELDASLAEAREAALVAAAALSFVKEKANSAVRRVHDDAWNDVGRPRADAAFWLIFPGGSAAYTDGAIDRQPMRMELLAMRLEKSRHAKLDASQRATAAAKVRASGAELKTALEAWGIASVNVELYERTRTTMARAAHAALTSFKRALKNAGLTEAQIHDVIPVGPKPSPKKVNKGKAPAESAAAPGTAPSQA